MNPILKFLHWVFLPLIKLWLPTKEQREEAADMFSGWLEKLSVVCIATALFQPKHLVLGSSAGVICLFLAISIKTRRRN